MCLQVRDALTVGSISLSSHFFSVKMDVKDALKALGNEMRGFAILVEPPKTTFGKVRRRAAASPRAPLPTRLPATGPQDVLGKGWRRTRRRLHRAAARRDGTPMLLHQRKVTLLCPQATPTSCS
tara:strand:+ start:123 stop:494 length:372 start_codon:yes stop_codon:yes gene_type:complete